MAATKKPRAKAIPKKAGKKPAKGKTTVSAARKVKAPARRSRKKPETLRLKSFTPSLTVNDLSKSLAFYTEGLGFIVDQRWSEGEVLRGAMLKAGVSEFGISQDDWKLGTDRKKGVGFRIFCETTQDIDAIADRVKAKGFTLTEEPKDNPAWGVRSFSIDDPDGFHLTITRSL